MAQKETRKKPNFKKLLDHFIKSFKAGIWRSLREEVKRYDKSEDIISGIDITDYFGPAVLKLSSMYPIVESIVEIHSIIGEDVVVVGVERKGYAFLGALISEYDKDEIKPIRSRDVTEKDVKGKVVILVDDASKTGSKIIKETERLKKFGASLVIAYVVISTIKARKTVKARMKKDRNFAFFPLFLCDNDDEYSELYSAFYHIVNVSSYPVTGAPKGEIIFDIIDEELIIRLMYKLQKGEYIHIDSIEDSSPLRGTVDYRKYILDHGADRFKGLGDKTGFFIKLDQAKIRLYYNCEEEITVKLCPIVYLEIPKNVNCRDLKKCKKDKADLTALDCVKCIEKMIANILLELMREDLQETRGKIPLKYKFKIG